MNIDERLEKLVARHEALTHTVELMAAMQVESQKRIATLESLVTEIAVGTARLLNTVERRQSKVHDVHANGRLDQGHGHLSGSFQCPITGIM